MWSPGPEVLCVTSPVTSPLWTPQPKSCVRLRWSEVLCATSLAPSPSCDWAGPLVRVLCVTQLDGPSVRLALLAQSFRVTFLA